ncbi:MAG: hypothetical protein NTU80_03315 [Verrucomicrobia bacterium]|nr:hypothetical protein [Verrucomicrobiota bacterium]
MEAKREGVSFELPAGLNNRTCKIQFFKQSATKVYSAIEQVCSYAQKRGISTAIATNGRQFIGFVAVRDDGISPLEGHAIVYSSLDEAKLDFLNFWNYFSKDGVKRRLLKQKLISGGAPALPVKLSRNINGYPGFQRRNSLQADLQVVSEMVFEDLAKAENLNEQFLRECYCESGALSQYALVSKTILETRYNTLFDSSPEGPTVTAVNPAGAISAELFAESLSKRPVLLIGDVGVGKSSFINYLTTVHMPELKSKGSSGFLVGKRIARGG